MKKTEPEYYPPVENLLDLIYEHYTENNRKRCDLSTFTMRHISVIIVINTTLV